MPGNIKGITIEFKADTTKLDKSLRSIATEAKAIDKALKFNPKNVDLLRQKYQVLTKQISETEKKLNVLREAQKKADADPNVDKNSAEYRELQREIIKTESQLKKFNAEQKKIKAAISPLGQVSAKFKQVGDALTKAGQAMRGFSVAGAAVVGTLGTMTYKASEAADEIMTLSKKYRISTKDLQKYAMSAEMVDVDVETITKSHVKLEKTMYSAAQGSKTNAAYFDQLGVSIYDANGNLRDADEVWNDTIIALGQVENETERDAIAMSLLGKSAMELNPLIDDAGETYKRTAEIMDKYGLEFIDDETLEKANEFNDEIQTIRAMAGLAFQTIGAKLAKYLLPALEKVVEWVGMFAQWLSNLDPRLLTIIAAIGGLVAVIAPLLTGLGQLAFAISSITGLMSMLGVSFGGIVVAAAPVIAIIAAIIAIGVVLYKNWDTIKAAAITLWNNIKTTFNNIKTSIVNTWNSVKSFLTNTWNSIVSTATNTFNNVKNAVLTPIINLRDRIRAIIDTIKGFFSFKVKTPHIPMPHFKITPSGWKLGDLLKGSIPHLGIDWYKTGGIFNSPSVIGVGEAGPEAVLPLGKLREMLDASNAQMVGALATALRMGSIGGMQQPIVIEIGGTKVAEVIYKLNRQGSMIMEAM